MRTRSLVAWVILGAFFVSAGAGGQAPDRPDEPSKPIPSALFPQSTLTLDEIIERTIAREKEELEAISHYSPIVETYIQEVRPDKQLGIVPKSDYYFLGQADFGKRLKVHSLLYNEKKGTWMWTYEPAGFLQMILVDGQDFDKFHYQFSFVRREFQGEVRCYVFDVTPAPKTRGARFVGRIWVEDQDMTIVHFKGTYAPSSHFSLKTLEDEYYLHFDSWRTNVKPELWLPSYVYIQELHRPFLFGGPSFKAQTYLWGYRLTPAAREAELSRLLVESSATIKEEAPQHDRSPLEAQREWRHDAESNVLDLLERNGLLAPPGEVDKVMDTIIKNLEITNNLDEQVDVHCRLLLTSNLEMFSVGSTVVLSRGLIDVVPDEATMAAMLAHGLADAMLPKPYQDQYAFSDIMRLTATQVLKHLSFEDEKMETTQTGAKALELLKKSPYVSKLGNVGLFLKALHSQTKQLKHLITPQLGNEVYFESQLMQAAPTLQPTSKQQIVALPLGSRLKIDPWTARVSLRKSRPISLLNARDKMPFEVTPMVPYLTRYVETSSSLHSSDLFGGLN